MTERIITGYRRLFEILLFHHYWLDDGVTVFDSITSPELRNSRMMAYDVRAFLKIAPTSATAKALSGYACVYKNTAHGCLVAAPDNIEFPDDTTFDFTVTVQQKGFYNYTALTLLPQNIYELYYKPEDKIRRFKENIPVLSNLTGASRLFASGKMLFLSKEFPELGVDGRVESLVLSGSSLMQLTSDQPGAATQLLNSVATDSPVFLHQGDVPVIMPPDGLTGAPERGMELTSDIPDNLFALVRISAKRLDDDDFSFIGADGHAKAANNPVFQIRFKNRSTIWAYKNTGFAEPAPLPLTYFGNSGTKQKPSQGLVKVMKSGDKITRIVSEIFT